MRISVGALALLLVISGLLFVVYSTTVGYRTSLHVIATRQVRATQSVIDTNRAQQQATVRTLGTAQANINATATAQTDAKAQATEAVDGATATATSLSDLLTQSTTKDPTFHDTLADNTGNGKWDEGNPTTNRGCVFKDGNYHVNEAQKGLLQPCIAQGTQFANFIYKAQVTLNQGQLGQVGLLFQINGSDNNYYFFYISSDGTYALDLYNNNNQVNLTQGTSTAIMLGLGQSNELAVLAKDGIYSLYANGQYLATVTDHSLNAGKIGLAVVDRNVPVDAQFSNAQVWKI